MRPLWQELAAAGGSALSDLQNRQLDTYVEALLEKNKVLNLTRITSRPDAEIKHVADALTLLPLIPKPAKTLADVGTGGGIPGVILAITRPELRVTLIDSTQKKLDAVQAMCEAVGIKNVSTLHDRIEAVELKFDVVTARAVADLGKLLGWCRGMMKPQSTLLAMKGPRAAEEIAALSPPQKRQWTIRSHAVAVDALAGHIIVEAKIRS